MTQAQARQQAKERVRRIKRALKVVDTRLEVMERRLDKLLERKTLITAEGFESFLENLQKFFDAIRALERIVIMVMALFRILSGGA